MWGEDQVTQGIAPFAGLQEQCWGAAVFSTPELRMHQLINFTNQSSAAQPQPPGLTQWVPESSPLLLPV